MSRRAPAGGARWPLFVCCLGLTAFGLLLDFVFAREPAFWLGDERGAGAAIGAGAAVLFLLARIAGASLLQGRARRPRQRHG